MAKKCTHPKGYDSAGRCPICRQRKPGRPSKARATPPRPATPPRSTASSVAPTVRETPSGQASSAETSTDRATRISRAYPPQLPAASAPTPAAPTPDSYNADDDTEPEPIQETTEIGYGWDWTAKKLTTGLDMGTSLVIEHFLGREPLDAGEEETEELQRVTAEYGEKKIGKVEAPIWLVFLIALVFFFLSKYAGAPKREPPAKSAPKPAPPIPGKETPVGADTAATKIPGDVADAATTETQPPLPVAAATITGSAEPAAAGY
jgi:hypothetical protein